MKWRVLKDPIFVAYCAIGIRKNNESLREFLNVLIYDLHSSGNDHRDLEEVVRRADGGAGRRRPVLLKARRTSTTRVVEYTFQFGDVFAQLPYLLGGALVTLQIAFLSFWAGRRHRHFGATSRVYGGPLRAAASPAATSPSSPTRRRWCRSSSCLRAARRRHPAVNR